MQQNPLNPSHLDQLHQVLELEIEQYAHAVKALEQKKLALVSRNPKDLIPVDRQLMGISRKSKQLEQQRKSIMSELGQVDGSLSKLIAQMDSMNANRFQNTRQRLLRTIEDMGRLNAENRSLLTLSLTWLQETIEVVLAAISPEGASYNAQGGKQKGHGSQPPAAQSTISHSA